MRNQNNALDEALNHSREMRDNQARELASTKDQLAQATAERDRAASDNVAVSTKLGEALRELEQAKAEAAQWADEADKLSKERDTAHAKLDSIHVALGLTPQAMQVPAEPVPTPPVQAITDTPHWPSEPSPVAEPTPQAEPATSTEWQPGYSWDANRQLYVKH